MNVLKRDQLDGVKKDQLNGTKRGSVKSGKKGEQLNGTPLRVHILDSRVIKGRGISFQFLAYIQILSTCTKLIIVRTAVVILWAQAVALASQGRVVTIPII